MLSLRIKDKLPPRALEGLAFLLSLPSRAPLQLKEGPLSDTWTLRGEFLVPKWPIRDEGLTEAYFRRVKREVERLARYVGEALLGADIVLDTYYNYPGPSAQSFRIRVAVGRRELIERRRVLKHMFDPLYRLKPSLFREDLEFYLIPDLRMLDASKLEEIPEWRRLKEALIKSGCIDNSYRLTVPRFETLEREINRALSPLEVRKCVVCGKRLTKRRRTKRLCSSPCRQKRARVKKRLEGLLEGLGILPGTELTEEKLSEIVRQMRKEEKRRASYTDRFGVEPRPVANWRILIRDILEGGK